MLYPHHQITIDRTTEHFQAQPEVRALLLAGSIAHGLSGEGSDVDVLILVSDKDYEARVKKQQTVFVSTELAGYEGGYVDGKYLSEGFLAKVEEKGSEPARFAFADARILFSHVPDLPDRLERIVRYPVEEKFNRIARFNAQLEAWHWYVSEAAKKQNPYLMATAVSRLLLFGGRMLLAHNEMLYPFHKWFLAILNRAPDKPEGVVELMMEAGHTPSQPLADRFYDLITSFRQWEKGDIFWPNWFMQDTELSWMDGSPPIDDL